MIILVRLLGISIVGLGIIFMIDPKTMKAYISFWEPLKRIRSGAILSLVIGVIFLLSASQGRLAAVINIFGILAIIKGAFLLAAGQQKVKSLLGFWKEKSDKFVRFYSLVVLAFGMLLIYST